MTREEILAGVRECLAAVVDVEDPAAIREEDRIIAGLGADSLDLLQLTFQLEQRFKIRISPRDIERRARANLGNVPLDVDGVYTPEAVRELRKALPDVPVEELPEGLTTAALPRTFRVSTMVNLVSRLLEEKG